MSSQRAFSFLALFDFSQASRVFFYDSLPSLAHLDSFPFFVPHFVSDDFTLDKKFFYRGDFSISPFSPPLSVRRLFSEPEPDSFLQNLFGWKIFVPSKGEFGLDSFTLPIFPF